MAKTCTAKSSYASECGMPAPHAAYGPDGKLKYYCAKHFDAVVEGMRQYLQDGRCLDAIQKVRKLNPGLL
jgi:hypothetical protein